MPTYQYLCTKCEHEFDQSQAMTDRPLTVCPKELCGLKRWGKGRVKRMITAGAGLIFKGSGFYITDYRSENYKESAKKESSAATPSAASDSKGPKTDGKAAKTETKPATKTSS